MLESLSVVTSKHALFDKTAVERKSLKARKSILCLTSIIFRRIPIAYILKCVEFILKQSH